MSFALPRGAELRVADVVRRAAAERGGAVALRHGARAITYRELDERSNRLAQAPVSYTHLTLPTICSV